MLLTGASGFVGAPTIAALLGAGHEVHAVTRRAGPPVTGVSWHEADLLETSGLIAEIEPELLVHLAWFAEHGSFWTAPENVRWVEASLALLRAFADAGGRRAVIAGTCAEYAWTHDVYAEGDECRPATLYGSAKHGLHVIAEAFAKRSGISLAWGRIFFMYGPGEAPGRLVPSLARSLLAGEPARTSAGRKLRDLLHVDDVGSAFAALTGSTVEGAVNIGSGEGIALEDLASAIAHHAGAPGRLELGSLPAREGDPPSLVADVERLSSEVGWRPSIALDRGLAETVAWWRERTAEPAEPLPRPR